MPVTGDQKNTGEDERVIRAEGKDGTASMITHFTHYGKSPRVVTPLLLLLAVLVTFQSPSSAWAAEKPQSEGRINEQQLAGRWLRLDGGYILELKEIGTDGTLKAFYYNPRPINVTEAKYSRKDGVLKIFVELRDVNYPGSKYNLHYDPKSDRLIGTYFQAVQGETYRVEFMRMK
ncbi:MAG TPA: hypothetical protein VLX12_11670 [Syntrophorhabdales bacterium]|nr:hypothetical protein [Syntrophorhabdales bacterium]